MKKSRTMSRKLLVKLVGVKIATIWQLAFARYRFSSKTYTVACSCIFGCIILKSRFRWVSNRRYKYASGFFRLNNSIFEPTQFLWHKYNNSAGISGSLIVFHSVYSENYKIYCFSLACILLMTSNVFLYVHKWIGNSESQM